MMIQSSQLFNKNENNQSSMKNLPHFENILHSPKIRHNLKHRRYEKLGSFNEETPIT